MSNALKTAKVPKEVIVKEEEKEKQVHEQERKRRRSVSELAGFGEFHASSASNAKEAVFIRNAMLAYAYSHSALVAVASRQAKPSEYVFTNATWYWP